MTLLEYIRGEHAVNATNTSCQKGTDPSRVEIDVSNTTYKIDTTFQLPITYLDQNDTYLLKSTVSDDLELVSTSTHNHDQPISMYEHLFLPKHEFAMDLLPAWNKHYTTNIPFLTDTQLVVNNMQTYLTNCRANQYSVSCEKLKTIWKKVKDDPYFLEKYNYLDWSVIKHFNESSSILQGLAVIQIMSPLISFILPILFLIFPFILLKLQGVSISVSAYIQTLKHIARNHFIGKAITSFDSFSWDKFTYGIFIFGMYIFQIYQNVVLCKRFYTNIQNINNDLLELRDYIDYSISSMDSLLLITTNMPTYQPFNFDVELHRDSLIKLRDELKYIYKFENSIAKLNDVGYMLKCYYRIYSDHEYEVCLRYSFGFEGYMNNLIGLFENLSNGKISYAKFNENNVCYLRKQYYPAILGEEPVKNSCRFSKNMIISSPNKSGKTTILKATAINIILSQQVGCGFYDTAMIAPYTHIHSYLNIPDTSGRDSLFQAESRRCKEILDTIIKYSENKYRHFCVFDELYSGTNPEEASNAGYAFLQYLHEFPNTNYILTTHYFSICKKYKHSEFTKNYKMEVIIDSNGNFKYTYKLKKGISKIKGGLRVLKDMGYPVKIISAIENQ
jgi:hypothetical protein